MVRKITHHLRVTHVEDGRVICSGTFATADGKGTHSLLCPVLHLEEVEHAQPILVGDTIYRHADGTHHHRPKPSA